MIGSGTWRWAALALVAATVIGCGRQDERASSGPVEVDGKSVDVGQLQRDGERADKAARKGAQALTPASLPGLLPSTVAGYARTNVASEPGPEPGSTKVWARYVKGDRAFELRILDFGAIGAADIDNDQAVGAVSERKTATGYGRVSNAGGRTVTEEWDDASKSGLYTIYAPGRFSISAEGSAETVDVLKAATETVNAARLWALAR